MSVLRAQNTDALVSVEKTFAKDCLDNGIRRGFLLHLDSNAVILQNAQVEKAKTFWTSLPSFPGIFSWSPSYAEISIDGNWGYTTGNFEHRKKTGSDTADDWGAYNTVWHISSNGEWKYLIDMGVDHPPASPELYSKPIDKEKFSCQNNADFSAILKTEQDFDLLFEKNPSGAYQQYASKKYLMNITGYPLQHSPDIALPIFKSMTDSPRFLPAGQFISPSKDLIAVYGFIQRGSKKTNYMRIWRFEGSGWKIALDVLPL